MWAAVWLFVVVASLLFWYTQGTGEDMSIITAALGAIAITTAVWALMEATTARGQR